MLYVNMIWFEIPFKHEAKRSPRIVNEIIPTTKLGYCIRVCWGKWERWLQRWFGWSILLYHVSTSVIVKSPKTCFFQDLITSQLGKPQIFVMWPDSFAHCNVPNIMLIFSNGVRKQFGVASWADTKCGRITGWYQPGAVMSWIQQNSQYGGGSGSTSSSGSSSSSYNQQTTNNQYQQNRQQHHQQNRHNQQRPTTSHNSYNSNSGSSSQSAQRVKKELQKLRSQFDQMLALL